MAELKAISNDAFDWLNGNDPSQWSESHFSPFYKSDMLLNNLSECFNKMILEARDKPILTLMEMVRRPTTSSPQTNPFFFIPTPGLAPQPTQQPPNVMTVRWMSSSQESYSVDQNKSNTLTKNVQEHNNYEGLRKRPNMV
ncbi:hypothetical protein V6N13_018946 [Hibiscus sabdariffa]